MNIFWHKKVHILIHFFFIEKIEKNRVVRYRICKKRGSGPEMIKTYDGQRIRLFVQLILMNFLDYISNNY